MLNELLELAPEIHASNVTAGWWTDLKTGESILTTRNRGEILMLVVSELSEADEGRRGCLMDDKLPARLMFDVELGDTAIRLLDLIGAEDAMTAVPSEATPNTLMAIVNLVVAAFEHLRKNRQQEYRDALVTALLGVAYHARLREVDLLGCIAEKRAYNAIRADHQIANRLKEDGKQF
ncbi:hypothetical protein U1872_06230 [Sphingomonas sp. RB3P16]|uniref:hypothetical protein n=1 Tax=Parasphingomonas frigoris TaxID=3096163 RepID=UPI002FCB73C4